MPNTSSVSPIALVDPNDPALTTPLPDYTAIRDGKVTERYQNASSSMQRYALALDRLGKLDWGTRLLNCCRAGDEVEICEFKKFANAHKHHCGDPFCLYDSRGRYRFNKWAATRDPETFSKPHTAFQLTVEGGACDCDVSWAEAQLHTATKLAAIVWEMMEGLGREHVTVDAYAERVSNVSVRVVFPGTLTYTQLQYWAERSARTIPKAHVQITVKHGTPLELFHWAFNGFHELAALDADRKAELRIRLADHRTVESRGDCYRPLSKERLAANAEEVEPCVCPVCKNHDLTRIPPAERHARPVEEIMDEYDQVNWGREYDSPFLIRKKSPTDNSVEPYSDSSTSPAVAPSPPPW